MLNVKESKPYDLARGLGRDYQIKVSRKTAVNLSGPNPLPKRGFDLIIQSAPGNFGFRRYLTLANISGDFYLCSAFVSVEDWPDTFGVKIKRCIPA